MGQHRDWKSDKRRDLARSTCSPLKRTARAAREAKRNANRRERRAQITATVAVRKNSCLCSENPDFCPQCDQETTHFDVNKSRPKAWPWCTYSHCYGHRWESDKFSQIFRWADSRRAEISLVELRAEILALGKSSAHAHAIFHLLLFYFPKQWPHEMDFWQAPKMTTAALKSSLQERGIEWRNKPKSLLTEIARRICTYGSFEAADKWSTDLSCNPLRGIQDIHSWASETQRLFDAMWGPRFLETPQGRWVIGELVATAVPKICKVF